MEDHDLLDVWNYLYKGIQSARVLEIIKKREIATFKLRFPNQDYMSVILRQLHVRQTVERTKHLTQMHQESVERENKERREMESYIAQTKCQEDRDRSLMLRKATEAAGIFLSDYEISDDSEEGN